MKRRIISDLWAAIGFLLVFALWTALICGVDVQTVGPNGTSVGFAAFNLWFHRLTGVHMAVYSVTDWLGLVPIAVCLCFGLLGAAQLVVFIMTRQPYAGIVCFTFLVIKGILIAKVKQQ